MKLKKIALGCAMAVGAATAQAADVVLFPYVVSGGAVTTIVSVINLEGSIFAAGGFGGYYNTNGSAFGTYDNTFKYLHWRYHVKTANTAAAPCLENNGYFPTSPLDLVSYDVSGDRGVVVNGNPTGVMFSDPSVNNNWQAVAAVNQWNAVTLSGERAVLFVHNAANAVTPGLLRGEAIVVEFDTGAAWGYTALQNGTLGVSVDDDFNFSPTAPVVNAQVGPANDAVTLMPMQEITTRFFVTPVNDPAAVVPQPSILLADGLDTPWFGSLRTRVDLSAITGSIRVLNRDEGGVSGGVAPQDVVCVFPVDANQLIFAQNVLNYTNPQGGWVNLATSAPTTAAAGTFPTPNAIVIKLEFRAAGGGGDFDMAESVGAFNNSYYINPRM